MPNSDSNEVMNAALAAYEESTGNVPDTRDFVALENAVKAYTDELDSSPGE